MGVKNWPKNDQKREKYCFMVNNDQFDSLFLYDFLQRVIFITYIPQTLN